MEEYSLKEGELYKNLSTILLSKHDIGVTRSIMIPSGSILLCLASHVNKTKVDNTVAYYTGYVIFLYNKLIANYYFSGPHPKHIFEIIL